MKDTAKEILYKSGSIFLCGIPVLALLSITYVSATVIAAKPMR